MHNINGEGGTRFGCRSVYGSERGRILPNARERGPYAIYCLYDSEKGIGGPSSNGLDPTVHCAGSGTNLAGTWPAALGGGSYPMQI